jgi:hypothetical protein
MATGIRNRLAKLTGIQWAIAGILLIAIGFTAFSTFRAARRAAYWREHRDQPIESWMTVGYIARSYQVSPHIVLQAIGLQANVPDRRPLFEIAEAQGRAVESLIADIEVAILEERDRRRKLPPGGSP